MIKFKVGEQWAGCWDCMQTFAICDHLHAMAAGQTSGEVMVVTRVEVGSGVVCFESTGDN